jgi:hypothetical protein
VPDGLGLTRRRYCSPGCERAWANDRHRRARRLAAEAEPPRPCRKCGALFRRNPALGRRRLVYCPACRSLGWHLRYPEDAAASAAKTKAKQYLRDLPEMAMRAVLRDLRRQEARDQARLRARDEREPRTRCRNGHLLGADRRTCWECVAGQANARRGAEPGRAASARRRAENRRRKRLGAETRARAHHHGREWAPRELEIAARPDLTARQAALMLGRTYKAVENRRGKLLAAVTPTGDYR